MRFKLEIPSCQHCKIISGFRCLLIPPPQHPDRIHVGSVLFDSLLILVPVDWCKHNLIHFKHVIFRHDTLLVFFTQCLKLLSKKTSQTLFVRFLLYPTLVWWLSVLTAGGLAGQVTVNCQPVHSNSLWLINPSSVFVLQVLYRLHQCSCHEKLEVKNCGHGTFIITKAGRKTTLYARVRNFS